MPVDQKTVNPVVEQELLQRKIADEAKKLASVEDEEKRIVDLYDEDTAKIKRVIETLKKKLMIRDGKNCLTAASFGAVITYFAGGSNDKRNSNRNRAR